MNEIKQRYEAGERPIYVDENTLRAYQTYLSGSPNEFTQIAYKDTCVTLKKG